MLRLQPLLALALLSAWTPTAPAQAQEPGGPLVQGSVLDGQGPVTGAKVRVQGQPHVTMTDDQGQFQLSIPAAKSKRVTGWKKGYGIGAALTGQKPIKLTLIPLPSQDHEEYEWIDPTPNPKKPNNCGNCHPEIYKEWHASAHGQSVHNPRFLSLFGGTDWHGQPSPTWHVLKEHPLGSAVCASCHAPTFNDHHLDYDLRMVPGVAARGIHCDYCHKIVDAPTDKLGLRFGRDGLVLLRPKGEQQLFFGPLDDAFREGETFGYLPLYKESRYCASCHEGVVFGVHVYGTYSEWLKSPAKQKGQQCQDCHMKPTGKMTNIAPGEGGIERDPLTLASHHFPGATTEMLKQCLKLDVQIESGKTGTHVKVTVTAQQVGHQVPTGFIDRHVLLIVEALDEKGQAVQRKKGPVLPPVAGTSLAGKPGWLYAKLLHSPEGKAPSPFWLPHGKITDTRLKPEQADHREFVFAPGTSKVRVRLLYRRFWQEVAASKSWPKDEVKVVDKIWTIKPFDP